MKRIVLISLYLLAACTLFSQHKTKKQEAFYMLDENFKGVKPDKATYLLHSIKENDTCWQYETYQVYGPMITLEQFKDEKATVLHGQCVYFNSKGTRDSIAHFANGFREGPLYYFNDTGRVYLQKEYRQGILTETIDRIKKDAADAEEWKRKNDTTVKRIEVESGFPGGQNGWIKYISKNLVYPERAQTLKKQGTVVTQFIVDTLGHVFDIAIVKSVEFSIDQETLRIIGESPAWIPAFQDGRKVKSYKKQPLTFRLQ